LIKADWLWFACERVDSTVVLIRSGYYSNVLEKLTASSSANGLEHFLLILVFIDLQGDC